MPPDPQHLYLAPTAPDLDDDATLLLLEATLQDLGAQLGGAWELERAYRSWRIEQRAGDLVRVVGLTHCTSRADAPAWMLSWDVSHDVPEDRGLFLVLGVLAATTTALAAGRLAGLGAWTLALGLATGLVVGRVALAREQTRLPDTTGPCSALSAAVRDAIARQGAVRVLPDPS